MRLFGLIILLFLALAMIVRSNLQSTRGGRSFISVFVRIMMNHFQLLTLTATFDLEWPSQLTAFFKGLVPISEVSTQFISIDCFIEQRITDENSGLSVDSIMRVFYQKLIVLASVPFAVFILSTLAWLLIYLI